VARGQIYLTVPVSIPVSVILPKFHKHNSFSYTSYRRGGTPKHTQTVIDATQKETAI